MMLTSSYLVECCVCGKDISTDEAYEAEFDTNHTYWFCSEKCYGEDPVLYPVKKQDDYIEARNKQVEKNKTDSRLIGATYDYTKEIIRTNYVKNFTWMGRPILQYPSDMFVMQELIWEVKPETIIETGTAFGGTAIFYASVMSSLTGFVITIDKEIRKHNRTAIEEHPIQYDQDGYTWAVHIIEGDSVDPETIREVKELIRYPVMVVLDSDHTHDHVLQELKLYSPLVSVGSYIVVFDTAIEIFMKKKPKDRPWGPGNNPMTAVQEFMKGNDEFIVDTEVEARAGITGAPGGWLRRIK